MNTADTVADLIDSPSGAADNVAQTDEQTFLLLVDTATRSQEQR